MLLKDHIILFGCLLVIACKSQLPLNTEFSSEIMTYRDTQIAELTSSERSPLTAESVKNIRFFPPDQSFKVTAELEMINPDETIQISTYSGIQKEFIEYAMLSFELEGEVHSLMTHKNVNSMRMPMYKNKMFLMFMDLTTGESTYGGGRYIYIDESNIKNGQVVLDFNKAFNPYCAYSDGFNCPIPPPQNRLDIAINAGEKDFLKS